MDRRRYLAAVAGATTLSVTGCLGRVRGVDADITLVDADRDAETPPEVSVDGERVTARGTVRYGSSECGTVELAHVEYERSQRRLDLLVVAADDSEPFGGCTDDLVTTGYRVTATAPERPRRVTVTEHHVFGAAYSTTERLG